MLDLGQKITAAGELLPDIHIAHALVLSLLHTQSWDIVKIQLFNLEANKLTFSTVSATLIAEANCHAREKSCDPTCRQSATCSKPQQTERPETETRR